jgi:N6-adenosine-specific RNA methylase IME4
VPAAVDAVLWLWSTRPLLIRAPQRIIPVWGFVDSTDWAWIKTDESGEELESGTGLALLDQHEVLIHCTRGKGVKPGRQRRAAGQCHQGTAAQATGLALRF